MAYLVADLVFLPATIMVLRKIWTNRNQPQAVSSEQPT